MVDYYYQNIKLESKFLSKICWSFLDTKTKVKSNVYEVYIFGKSFTRVNLASNHVKPICTGVVSFTDPPPHFNLAPSLNLRGRGPTLLAAPLNTWALSLRDHFPFYLLPWQKSFSLKCEQLLTYFLANVI